MDELTTAQVSTEVQPQVEQPQQNPGFQARIDELVARAKQAEQQAQEYQTKMMEMAAAAVSARPQAPAPAVVDPLAQHREALDPRLVEVLEAQRRQFESQLAQRTQQLEAAQGKFLIAQQAAAVPGLDASLVARAQQLFEQSKMSGGNPTPDEALRYVLGDELLKQRTRAAGVAGIPSTFFNAPAAVVPSAPAIQPQVALPADFENRPLAEQLALMDRLGYGDKPL